MNWIHISDQILNLSIDYLTVASYEWRRERVLLPDDIQHRLTELHKALGDVLTVEPTKTEPMVELHLTEEEVNVLKSCLYARGITTDFTDADRITDKVNLALNEYYKRKNKED